MRIFRHVQQKHPVLAACLTAGLLVAGTAQAAETPPDLSGFWDNGSGVPFIQAVKKGESLCIRGCDAPSDAKRAPGIETFTQPDRPKYKPEVQARVDELNENQVDMDPTLRCLPPGVPRIGPPDRIVQTPDTVVFLYEDISGPMFRLIPLNQEKHRQNIDPVPLGYSIGWWEGETLVVETTHLTDDTWLTDDGSFHTEDLRVVERIRREGDTLYWQATAHDPAVLAEPWEMRERVAYLGDREIVQSPECVERDLEHMVDRTHHDNPR